MGKEFGVSVFGCGYWGNNYVRVFSELPHVRLVAVCDPRAERLEEVRRRYPNVSVTTDVHDALALDGIDAVVVCTPSALHFQVALQCLSAGKHVLVEKPITTSVADGQRLNDLAAANDLTLMVGHTFVYNSGIRRIKEYIVEKQMNRVYYLYARRTNLGPIRNDVNAMWDLASHDISIFNYLLGEYPAWVSAMGSSILGNGLEDVGFISIGYPGQIIGHIHVSWLDPNKVREVVVVGDNMRIMFNDVVATERVRVFKKGFRAASAEAETYGDYHLGIRDGDIISPNIAVSEPLKNQCNHFLDCISTGERPLTDGIDGLAVVRTLSAIDRSLAGNGARVPVTSEDGVFDMDDRHPVLDREKPWDPNGARGIAG